VNITTLFWDNGGVILTNGWDRGSRRAAVEKFQLDWAEFEDRHELMLDAFEKGEITLDEYLQRTVFYKQRPFAKDEFKEFMVAQSQQFPDSIEFLGKLARSRRYLMAALNNESLEINEYRVRGFQLRKYFDVFFSSCYLGMRKPLPGIYKKSLKISQREAGECILIDDRGLNLECARELGMNTIQFQNVPQLREELSRFGVTTDGN
jgi:putative hydrolase of the HAD superfamily